MDQPMTIADYAERWLCLHPRGQTDTDNHYRQMVRTFVEAFGHRELGSITRLEARDWALGNAGKARYVRALLNDAIDDELLDRNVFAALRLPVSKGRADIRIPTKAEVAQLLWGSTPDFAAAIQVAADTGVRLGELLALTWRDWSYLGTDLRVDKQLTKGGTVRRPKNGHGRTVVVADGAILELTSLRERRAQEAQDAGRVTDQDGRIFDWSRRTHYAWWAEAQEAAGLDFDFHCLRHYAATAFLEGGASEWDVAIQLGHRDGGKLVRLLYGHPDEGLVRDRLRAAVSKERDAAAV